MKLLTKETDYAVRALLLMARKNETFISSSAISEREKIPLQFLRRILRTLTKAGLIETKEGVAGGVKLARAADTIALKDIIALFQGAIQFTECLFRKKVCHNRDECVLRHRLMKIEAAVERECEAITIQTLINDLERADEEKNHNN